MEKESKDKNWPEVVMELVEKKEFLPAWKEFVNLIDRSVDKIYRNSEIKTNSWKSINKLSLILGFILRIFIITILGFSLWFKVISTEIFIILLAVVIGSLFGGLIKQ